MKYLQDEKKFDVLFKFSENLKKQKEIVFNNDSDLMINKLNSVFNTNFTKDILLKMENGISVDISFWICIWIYFQNIDDILIAYDPKELGFLLKQNDFVDIEKELLNYHKKIINDER